MDRLSKLLDRFPPRAGVFYSGGLCGVYDFDRETKPGHFHCVRAGRVEYVDSEGARHTIERPSVIFLPDADTHRLVAEPGVDVICATVRFSASARSPVLGVLPRLVVVDIDSSPALRGLVEPMFAEAGDAREGRQMALNLLCSLAVIEVIRHCISSGIVRSGLLAGLADARLSRALEAVGETPQRSWTLQEMAAVAGMSRSRFASAFREVIGITPGQYLLACRLSAARALLRQGAKLKQIAPQVGYTSISALTRALAREGGASAA